MTFPLTDLYQISEKDFEILRERSDNGEPAGLSSEAGYIVVVSPSRSYYAYTPDGVGCYHYNSFKQMNAEHGDFKTATHIYVPEDENENEDEYELG